MKDDSAFSEQQIKSFRDISARKVHSGISLTKGKTFKDWYALGHAISAVNNDSSLLAAWVSKQIEHDNQKVTAIELLNSQ